MDKKVNTLIPKLLKESKDLSKEIKTRIKANSIFNEFEKKAQNEFNFFVNDSNRRYTNAKFGHNIENYIQDSESLYKDKLNKIMNDKFYTELNLKPEKEKMKQKSTNKIHANILELLSDIKNTVDVGKSKSIYNNANFINNQNNKRRINKNFTENELSVNRKTIDYDEKLLFDKKNKNEINKVFNIDQVKLNKSIEKYKIRLNKLRVPFLGEENPEIKHLNIDLPQIKMLNYHKPEYKKNLNDEKVEKINLYKLIPYSKYAKDMPYIKNENKDVKEQDKPYFLTETINNKKNNYDSTNDLVVSTVQNNMRLRNNYNLRKNRMKNLLDLKIPSLDEYESILNNRFKKFRERRINRNKEINKKQSVHFLTNKDLMNYNIDKSIELLDEKKKFFIK